MLFILCCDLNYKLPITKAASMKGRRQTPAKPPSVYDYVINAVWARLRRKVNQQQRWAKLYCASVCRATEEFKHISGSFRGSTKCCAQLLIIKIPLYSSLFLHSCIKSWKILSLTLRYTSYQMKLSNLWPVTIIYYYLYITLYYYLFFL